MNQKLPKIINGAKKFALSYIILFKKPKLLLFVFLYFTFYFLNYNKDLDAMLLNTVLDNSIWARAFSFKFNTEQAGLQMLILISLFANFIFSWINIIINTSMGTYLTNNKNLFKQIAKAVKTSFKYLNWVFIFTIIDLVLKKLLARYTLGSIIFLIYLISYVIFILFTTWVNIYLSVENKDKYPSLIMAIKRSFYSIKKYTYEIFGVFLIFFALLPLSFLVRLLNLLTTNYKTFGFLVSALDFPIIIIVIILGFIVSLSFPASTVFAVLLKKK